MAIIFSSSVKQSYASQFATWKFGNTTGCAITLYSGTKPTPQAYIDNFATTYSNAQNAFLWHSNGLTTWATLGNITYMTTPVTAAAPVRNGVATWAVLWTTNTAYSAMNTLPATATGTGAATQGCALVDVSTVAAGTGVVQLLTTTLATTDAPFSIDFAGFSIA